MEIEKADSIMLAGHNGHIQKQSPNPTYVCMGEQLSKKFGDAYFAIGTDFIEGKVNVINDAGEAEDVEIKETNALKEVVKNLDRNSFYFDIENALQNEQLADILTSDIEVLSIGNEFGAMQKLMKFSYISKESVADNFDGFVIFKKVTPTVRKPL